MQRKRASILPLVVFQIGWFLQPLARHGERFFMPLTCADQIALRAELHGTKGGEMISDPL